MKNVLSFLIGSKLYSGHLTEDRINDILKSQGFKIIEFISEDNPLIKKLHLENKAEQFPCFTYYHDPVKYIFIKKNITKRDRVLLLLHEEGHIYLEHMTSTDELVHSTSVYKEYQANIFSYTVIAVNKIFQIKYFLLAAALICLVFTLHAVNTNVKKPEYNNYNDISNDYEDNSQQSKESEDSETIVYFTASGEVYHLYPNCRYIKGKDNVMKGTIKESTKKRCCSDCRELKLKEEFYKSFGTLPD